MIPIEPKIADIQIGGRIVTHKDWEERPAETLSVLIDFLCSEAAAATALIAPAHETFPARALRAAQGVAPLLEFPD